MGQITHKDFSGRPCSPTILRVETPRIRTLAASFVSLAWPCHILLHTQQCSLPINQQVRGLLLSTSQASTEHAWWVPDGSGDWLVLSTVPGGHEFPRRWIWVYLFLFFLLFFFLATHMVTKTFSFIRKDSSAAKPKTTYQQSLKSPTTADSFYVIKGLSQKGFSEALGPGFCLQPVLAELLHIQPEHPEAQNLDVWRSRNLNGGGVAWWSCSSPWQSTGEATLPHTQ